MNGFDFVVTIALGSVLATVSLNENIPLANGVTAMVAFIGFQFIFTWLSVRMKSFKTLITSSPTLIFYKGDFLLQTMKKERVTEQEVYCAARKMGISSLDGVDMIILETTGDIAIVEKVSNRKEPIFEDVQIPKTNDLWASFCFEGKGFKKPYLYELMLVDPKPETKEDPWRR